MSSTPRGSWLSIFVARELGTRDRTLDVLRGVAIMGMVLVNHSPPTGDLYAFVQHAAWTGWTFADTIFPMFLFLVGASITYSARRGGGGRVRYGRIARRAALLVALNVVLVNFPYYEWDSLKFHGTLTRIAFCYAAVALVHAHVGWRGQLGLCLAILLAQWWFLTRFDVPGLGAGVLEPGANAALYLDRMVFGGYVARMGSLPVMYGVVAAAGSVAMTLAGALAGRWLGGRPSAAPRAGVALAAGGALFVLGLVWSLDLPVSKALWSSSYVVAMTGLTLMVLGAVDALATRPAAWRVLRPFEIAGVNALFFYLFAQSLQRVLVYVRVSVADDQRVALRVWLYEQLVAPWLDGKPGALVFALGYLALCYAVIHLLYRQRVFVKL